MEYLGTVRRDARELARDCEMFGYSMCSTKAFGKLCNIGSDAIACRNV